MKTVPQASLSIFCRLFLHSDVTFLKMPFQCYYHFNVGLSFLNPETFVFLFISLCLCLSASVSLSPCLCLCLNLCLSLSSFLPDTVSVNNNTQTIRTHFNILTVLLPKTVLGISKTDKHRGLYLDTNIHTCVHMCIYTNNRFNILGVYILNIPYICTHAPIFKLVYMYVYV